MSVKTCHLINILKILLIKRNLISFLIVAHFPRSLKKSTLVSLSTAIILKNINILSQHMQILMLLVLLHSHTKIRNGWKIKVCLHCLYFMLGMIGTILRDISMNILMWRLVVWCLIPKSMRILNQELSCFHGLFSALNVQKAKQSFTALAALYGV